MLNYLSFDCCFLSSFFYRKDVETINQNNLKNLKAKLMEFNAIDSGEELSLKFLSNNCPAKSKIFLKIGAQVMLVKTIDSNQGLVNGARGIITKFMKETNSPVVRLSNGEEHIIMPTPFTVMNGSKVVARRVQIPLELSWAISVHKAQGITVDQAELHLQNAFEFGQVYGKSIITILIISFLFLFSSLFFIFVFIVALSRVKRLDGISLKSMIPASKIACDQLVLDFYQRQFHSNAVAHKDSTSSEYDDDVIAL
jgi:ATP-dependent DNA helicase PIF1